MEHAVRDKVYPLLPRMLDGSKGIAAWVPVDFNAADGSLLELVVLSVPVMKYLLVLHDPTLAEVDLESFLASAFDRYEFPGFTHHKMDMNDFKRLILKTPFRMYKVLHGTTTTKKNLLNYIIMDQEYWRDLLAHIAKEFGDGGKMMQMALEAQVPIHLMRQNWALTAVPQVNPSPEGPSTHIDVLGRALTAEERKGCPPMNSAWSREAYAGMRGYFGIPDDGTAKHVQSGVYDQSLNTGPVQTFAELWW